MKKTLLLSFIFIASNTFLQELEEYSKKEILLPKPSYKGSISFEETIYKWKATRKFQKDKPLTLQLLSQLLWAASGTTVDGVTSATRVYPSAGAIYPLDIYVVCKNIKDLESGIYKYNCKNHSLILVKKGDFSSQLAYFAVGQMFIAEAPVSFIWVGDYSKVSRYGDRGTKRYIFADLGHSAQNLTIQATALGLGTVQVGAFNNEKIKSLLEIKQHEDPLYIMPVGFPMRVWKNP